MKHSFSRLVIQGLAAGATLAFSACATTEGVHVARVEIHPFAATTLSDRQLLTGQKDGKPVTLAGELRIPTMGNDKMPAVVLLHGSSGVSGFVDDWTQFFNAMGIATFVPDSFTARGLVSVNNDQSKLGRLATMVDGYRSLELLSKHPRIDANRIALMGFSRGGQAALYSAMSRFQHIHLAASVPGFAAYIVFYPDCRTTYLEGDNLVDKPIRLFHGTADDYNPVDACRSYVARLRQAGKDIHLTEYAGAGHVFDWPMLKEPRKLEKAQTTRRCRLEETSGGVVLNSDTRQPFTYNDSCVDLGPTIGYHAEAHRAAQKDVREFITTALRLPTAKP